MVAVRSYLQFHDIDIVVSRFKRKVKIPKLYREVEEALDVADIRQILLSCNNRRLKPYLLVLASAGLRASEALAFRLCDIDFSLHPVKVHVRKEYSKTRTARDVYISDEAVKFLKGWIDWKYRKRRYAVKWGQDGQKIDNPVPKDTDLVFGYLNTHSHTDPTAMYDKIRQEFAKVLKTVLALQNTRREFSGG
jgi:integrase